MINSDSSLGIDLSAGCRRSSMTLVLSVQAHRETLDTGGELAFLEEYETGPYERRVPIGIKGSNMNYE
jgi:hypothetical protein